MAANGIDERQAYVMQPGQLLIIPQSPGTNNSAESGAASTAGDTPDAGATGAADQVVEPRVDAPVLLLPSDGEALDCSQSTSLSWQRVQFVKDSDKYLLHLGFVNGQNTENGEGVTWVLSQPHPVTQTSWQMDSALCDLAPESSGSQWRWWVEVVEQREDRLVPVSPPSVTRSFSWE